MKLLQYERPIPTIFDLIGTKENDMTAGLAFVLAASPCLLAGTISRFAGCKPKKLDQAIVKIQTARHREGITDIELICGDELFAVIEAKRGPIVPSRKQLECYARIVKRSKAMNRFLVTVSNATNEFAKIQINPPEIGGIPLVHLPWRAIKQIADKAIPNETNANKQLLNQFTAYLGELLGMENKYSNMVYVVSLSGDNPHGWNLSYIDVVEKRNRYFYPIGKGWPDPPNYLGFRYKGKLQSIRRVKSFITNTNPHEVFPEAPNAEWVPHYVLKLGPPIVPSHEVRNGPSVVRAGRCWCMIDALLTSQTISDALRETKIREAQEA